MRVSWEDRNLYYTLSLFRNHLDPGDRERRKWYMLRFWGPQLNRDHQTSTPLARWNVLRAC